MVDNGGGMWVYFPIISATQEGGTGEQALKYTYFEPAVSIV